LTAYKFTKNVYDKFMPNAFEAHHLSMFSAVVPNVGSLCLRTVERRLAVALCLFSGCIGIEWKVCGGRLTVNVIHVRAGKDWLLLVTLCSLTRLEKFTEITTFLPLDFSMPRKFALNPQSRG
jgi:hypothetical protein